MKVVINESECFEKIAKEVAEKQKIVDASILRYMDPYIPYQSGVLAKSAVIHTVIGSGQIVQITPYARRLYYNHYNFDLTKHPLAGAFWFERMITFHLPDIKREAGLK